MNIQRDSKARWAGVVMLIRPDISKQSEGARPMVHVVSAREIDLGGKRAVKTQLPYEMVAHHYKLDDGDAIEMYAELTETSPGEHHIQIIERASKREFFLHPEQSSQPAH